MTPLVVFLTDFMLQMSGEKKLFLLNFLKEENKRKRGDEMMAGVELERAWP